MSKYTQHYACEECVAPEDTSANVGCKKKQVLKPCSVSDPNVRKRMKFDKNRTWCFTPGLMIAWHGSLIYHGAKAGEKEPPTSYWEPLPYGTYAPFIQNTFPKHVWESCRRFIHLSDNKIP